MTRLLYITLLWSGHVARTVADELADTACVLENLAGELAPFTVDTSGDPR